jgi:hypothetical protein
MKKNVWFSFAALFVLVVPSFAHTRLEDFLGNKVRHTVIARSGDEAPEGGVYNPFSFSDATLNARHEIAFEALVAGPPPSVAIFARDKKNTSAVTFGFVQKPFITRDGDVIFDGNGAVFKSVGKRIVPLVKVGDLVHDKGTVTSLLGRIANNPGSIAYVAAVSGATATQAVVRNDGERTSIIASDDVAPPTGGSFTSFQGFDMNDRGQVAFKADTSGGSADHGLFRGEGGRVMPVFVSNQQAPTGGTFQDCGIPVINLSGHIAAVCLLANGPTNAGLFIGDGEETKAVALDGQRPPNARADYFALEGYKINNRDEVAFEAILTDGSSGIFRGNGKHTITLGLSGMKAPGTTGRFKSFGDFEFEGDGRIAFVADLVVGEGGVDTSNNLGIWVGTTEDDLKLLVRTSDVINGNILTNIPLIDTTGDAFEMKGAGILWRGNFGNTKALVLSHLGSSVASE